VCGDLSHGGARSASGISSSALTGRRSAHLKGAIEAHVEIRSREIDDLEAGAYGDVSADDAVLAEEVLVSWATRVENENARMQRPKRCAEGRGFIA
jgi:hypothetical protein